MSYPPPQQQGYPMPPHVQAPMPGAPPGYPSPYPPPYGQQPYDQGPPIGFQTGPPMYNLPHQPPGGVQPPIAMQPIPTAAPAGGQGWAAPQAGIPNCPPGLEYLAMIDQLLVHQKVELLEAFTGFETANKYTVKNSMGQKVFYAAEMSDCCSRQCCGPLRGFEMKIVDNNGQDVIHLNRPLACTSCCFPCCLQTMDVSSPPGNIIGSIAQEWSVFTPQFVIKDAAGDVIFKIKGPFCTFSLCGDVEFNVFARDGTTKIGKISKQWSGFVREAFTDADMFGINFPLDLDVKMKAVLLGACFLIDYMFFEKSGNKENDGIGMWS